MLGQKHSSGRFLELLTSFKKESDEVKEMEFFFYSKTKTHALGLKKDLEKLGYEIYGIDKSYDGRYSIIGITPPMSLEEMEFEKWVGKMNEIGFVNDCFFDGWGTLSQLD